MGGKPYIQKFNQRLFNLCCLKEMLFSLGWCFFKTQSLNTYYNIEINIMRFNVEVKRKVWRNSGSNQLLITIPHYTGIKPGDWVVINRKISRMVK